MGTKPPALDTNEAALGTPISAIAPLRPLTHPGWPVSPPVRLLGGHPYAAWWTAPARSPLKGTGKPPHRVQKPVPMQVAEVGIIEETTLFGRNLTNAPAYRADPLGVERGGVLRTPPRARRPQTPGHPCGPLGHAKIVIEQPALRGNVRPSVRSSESWRLVVKLPAMPEAPYFGNGVV